MSGYNHTLDKVEAAGGDRLFLDAMITGGASPVVTDSNITGLTVAKSATGKIRLTFTNIPANATKAKVLVTLGDTAAVDCTITVDSSAFLTSSIVDIYTVVGGSAADVSVTAQLHVLIFVKNTGVTRP